MLYAHKIEKVHFHLHCLDCRSFSVAEEVDDVPKCYGKIWIVIVICIRLSDEALVPFACVIVQTSPTNLVFTVEDISNESFYLQFVYTCIYAGNSATRRKQLATHDKTTKQQLLLPQRHSLSKGDTRPQ